MFFKPYFALAFFLASGTWGAYIEASPTTASPTPLSPLFHHPNTFTSISIHTASELTKRRYDPLIALSSKTWFPSKSYPVAAVPENTPLPAPPRSKELSGSGVGKDGPPAYQPSIAPAPSIPESSRVTSLVPPAPASSPASHAPSAIPTNTAITSTVPPPQRNSPSPPAKAVGNIHTSSSPLTTQHSVSPSTQSLTTTHTTPAVTVNSLTPTLDDSTTTTILQNSSVAATPVRDMDTAGKTTTSVSVYRVLPTGTSINAAGKSSAGAGVVGKGGDSGVDIVGWGFVIFVGLCVVV